MNSDCPFLNFAEELLVKFVEFLPMKDRVSVRETCSRMEEIVGKTDLAMTRYVMQFYLFNGTPWSTPFGMQEQGIDAVKMEEFVTARARLTKNITLSEVVLDKIDFETVDFALVRRALTDCSFERLFIVQNNVEYNERVESLIEEHRGKTIVFSALYFPYYQCIDQLSPDIELRFNYLHRQKVPGPGKNEDLIINLLIKGHSLCAAHWSSPVTVKEAFDASYRPFKTRTIRNTQDFRFGLVLEYHWSRQNRGGIATASRRGV
ncbi:hypothetical protein PRIPAC_95715 [Pristionchus pacificus]|uniref:Uncharacterized protein n=1 Tax=Pristionchus pacificus TaxID=54126 RepID=A0A2A6BXW2_PRIPA|nr:hypothetical protein PRIPAC_95715 [Pristionchus pacificus]|eukprot:PDM70667.1 hypothetical protein PRIPAC_43872 [Pristionchus pacificus]